MFPAVSDLFSEMQSWLYTNGNSEIMPEAPVFSSINAEVTSPPIVDAQQEMNGDNARYHHKN